MNRLLPVGLICGLNLLICIHIADAQQLSTQQKASIDESLVQIEKYQATDNKIQVAHYYNKIAYTYWEAGIYPAAIENFNKSLELNRTTGNLNAIYTIELNLGAIYSDLDDYTNSAQHLKESVTIAKSMRNKVKLANSLNQYAVALKNSGKNNDAIKNLEEGIVIALELDDRRMISSYYAEFADNYKALGNTTQYNYYYELFAKFDKYLREQEVIEAQLERARAEASARQTALQLELSEVKASMMQDSLKRAEEIASQKQMQLDLLNKDMQLQVMELKERDAKLKKERAVRLSLLGIFAVVLIFSLFLLREIRAKKRANERLEQQNILLQQQKFEIEQQNALLQKQKNEIEHQKEELNLAYTKISDSINYARKIQDAILPTHTAIKKRFPQSFIFYRPRDVVSGDFYWYSEQPDNSFLAVVDCTGHSVPGAFMSMIGNTMLNEIVNEKKHYDPAQILKELNKGIITTLKQKRGDADSQDDGMDITLCRIDYAGSMLHIASANHVTHVFQNGKHSAIEGDIFSIGGIFSAEGEELTYTNHLIPLSSDTEVYMFSDGFQDQFGGEDGKKFLASRFRTMLEEIHTADMGKQELEIADRFAKWKGDRRQIDDVLVIGIRIPGF